MLKNCFFMTLSVVIIGFSALMADALEDTYTLIEAIKKTDPSLVYEVLNKGTIDMTNYNEFSYLDFACCKLTYCIEKIERYNEKQKKWSDRLDSDYDQETVNEKIANYKALSEKWAVLKQQMQYIVQFIAYYLGMSQANTAAAEDLVEDVVEVIADVHEIVNNNTTAKK